ncbi:MAG: hypothetical protein IJ368_05160 [Oscillospiraceae bacterium]|nr:hypothetical protein [Oscillospiraceae bacterium]
MRPHQSYIPKKHNNAMLKIAVAAFAAAVTVMWFLRERLFISVSDLLIYTGLALLLIIFTIFDKKKKDKLYDDALELKDQREKIGDDDYNGSSIFFRD